MSTAREHLSLRPDAAVAEIAARAWALLAAKPGRVMIGLAGGPGVGKSTIAEEVVATVNGGTPGMAAYVPMDGFHMKHQKLEAQGTVADKGMPHTFEGTLFVEFLADLKAYHAIERTPLRGTYRGYEIVTMPPPSSGGIALLQMLGMIEPFDVKALGFNSAAKIHLFTEVMRRAFRDRAEYLGDPDFVKVPVAGLLDRKYIAHLMQNFDPDKATPSATLAPGGPAGWVAPVESGETTHFSIIDAAGNAVSNTYTLNGAFGSSVTIPGAGFLMNNEMDDFTTKLGEKNLYGLIQGPANSILPGKRPLSSMTPTLVLKDGHLVFATGSPGGSTIITVVFGVITNVLDHGMTIRQAVDAPRFHHQWMPDVMFYERNSISPDTAALLKARGQKIEERENVIISDAETVAINPKTGLREGASDIRKPDSKTVGY